MKLYILLNIDNSIKKLTIHSKSFEVTLSHFYKETIVQRLLAGLPYVIYTLILQLTSLLAELGLDIQEAHAFSTIDGYSLDVIYVVNDNFFSCNFQSTEQLQGKLLQKFHKVEVLLYLPFLVYQSRSHIGI